MKILINLAIFTLITAGLATGCGKQEENGKFALVKMLVGTARVERGGATVMLAVGDRFGVGEVVRTAPRSVLIASIGDGEADLEIQENAIFSISSLKGRSGELALRGGSLWLRLNRKLLKGDQFSLRSPTAVASVRGTKFYTFKIGAYYGTCMCQGSADYESTAGEKFSGKQEQDYLIVSDGKLTAVISHDDLKPLAIKDDFHQHSMLDNSPLGRRVAMTPEQFKTLLAIIENKFKKAALPRPR
jgi:hypothetical protein